VDRIGFIGYGSMGSMLLSGFLRAEILSPAQVCVSARTRSRTALLHYQWPEVEILEHNKEIAQRCNRLFICVKPFEVKDVLEEIKGYLRPETHIISIAACVSFRDMRNIFLGKITRVVPTFISEVGQGVSLVCNNCYVEQGDSEYIQSLLMSISNIKIIEENDIEIATSLTSCAPGLIAAIFEEFADSGLRYSNFTREEVITMVINTLYGTAKLLYEREMLFNEMIERVATKGGITEKGVSVLRSDLPGIFDEVFKNTLGKFEDLKKVVRAHFTNT
jgi:pyrroline-5-carboxylate reductase